MDNLTPEQVNTLIGFATTAILLVLGAVVQAIRIFSNMRRENQESDAKIKLIHAETNKLEIETRAEKERLEAEKDKLAAEVATVLAKSNADSIAIVLKEVQRLNLEVLNLRSEVSRLSEVVHASNLQSKEFEINWKESIKVVVERNKTIVELKVIIEDLRKKLIEFIEQKMGSDSTPEASDVRLLNKVQADQKDAKETETTTKE